VGRQREGREGRGSIAHQREGEKYSLCYLQKETARSKEGELALSEERAKSPSGRGEKEGRQKDSRTVKRGREGGKRNTILLEQGEAKEHPLEFITNSEGRGKRSFSNL